MACLLGLDLGTSSLKALIVTDTGQSAGVGSAEYPILRPQPECAEQDPEDWWNAAALAVNQALSASPGLAADIAAIGLTGQMHGTVVLDRSLQALHHAVIWPDRRSERQVLAITELIGAERLIQITGSPLATGFQAATLRWIREEQPSLWRQVRHVLLPKDYLRWRLTGHLHTDPSDGAGTLLLDTRLRDWSPDLLAALDLDANILPPIAPSSTIVGQLTRPAAAHLGLPPGIPVVMGAADTASSALGTGIVSPDTLLITISTGGQLVLPAYDVRVDRLGRIHTFCGALEPADGKAAWYQMAATLCAGMALRWLRDQIFGIDSPDAYNLMMSWAESASLGAGGLVFLPYLVGERSPHMDPAARGVFLGLSANHGRAELVRAVMEGIALSCYDAYQVLIEIGADPGRVILAGGGGRSRLWQHIFADVFDLPLQRLATTEQSALGACLLAGAGIGLFDPAVTAAAWTSYDPPVEPDHRNHAAYGTLLEVFRSAYRVHANDFRVLREYEH
jgi:xylulokinase